VKYLVRVFWRSASCECSSEVFSECSSEVNCGSVLVKCFVQVF
jgi:hypothetical protein